ncbi:MAG: hypothetical protein MI807_23085 [Verrucomicrobiales bacterium]|nr:hypothetical protein [Verrucomicrobiales bacterium]
MRLIQIAFAISVVSTFAQATTPTLTSITQPLFYLGSAGDAEIQFIETPKIINNAGVMFWVELFHNPTDLDGADGDLNLISLYGLTVSLSEWDAEGNPTLITIDATRAIRPPRYPFTVEEVADAATKAVRIEFPDVDTTKISVLTRGNTSGNSKVEQAEALKP